MHTPLRQLRTPPRACSCSHLHSHSPFSHIAVSAHPSGSRHTWLAVLLPVLLLLSCLSPPLSAQSATNPCPSPYTPLKSLTFPQWYSSAYLSTTYLYPSSCPFNTASTPQWTVQFFLNNVRNYGQNEAGPVNYAATLLQAGNETSLGTAASAGSHVNITWDSGDHMVMDLGGGGNICTTTATWGGDINSWHHWAFTYSYSGGSATMSIYRDGTQVCLTQNVAAIAITEISNILIGNQAISMPYIYYGYTSPWSQVNNQIYQEPWNLNNPFGGYLADFRMYGRVLSASELVSVSSSGIHTNNSQLLMRYKFNEGSGQTAADSGSLGLTLTLNSVADSVSTYGYTSHQPQWTNPFIYPLCLFTPTALSISGPPSSPNCQAVGQAFTVAVSVLDSAGAVITSSFMSNSRVSLAISGASVGSQYVTLSSSTATVLNGVATFTLRSSVAQYVNLSATDASNMGLISATSVIQIMPAQGVYFANTTVPAYSLVNTAYNLTLFAGTCGGLVVAPGAQLPTWVVQLRHNSTHLSLASGSSITLPSSGYASVQLTDSVAEQVQLSLVNATLANVLVGGSLTAYWTSSTLSQLRLGQPYLVNDTRPTASSFYSDSTLYLPLYAADSTGGPIATFNTTATLVLTLNSSSSGSSFTTQQNVPIVNGVGYVTVLPQTVGTLGALLVQSNSSVQATIVGGRASSVIIRPINVTQINVVQASSVSIQLVVLDVYGNAASGYSGQFTVVSSNSTSSLNGGGSSVVVAVSSSVATFTFSSSTTGVAVLSLVDSAGSLLNVSARQAVYVQSAASSCPAGRLASGVLDWQGAGGGTFHNSGGWLSLGSNSFSLTAWVYITNETGPVYLASMQPSQAYYAPGTIFDTMYVGVEQLQSETGVPGSSMTFEMSYEKGNLESWAEYNQLNVAPLPSTSQWVHWAFSFDASSNSQTMYCNGQLVGQRTGTAWNVLGSPQGAWHLAHAPIMHWETCIAAYTFINGYLYCLLSDYAYAAMDDLRVYSRALSSYEPLQMYEYNTYANTAGLLMHYAFDEGTGTTYHDSTASHIDVPMYPNSPQTPRWRADIPNCLPTASQLVLLPVAAVRLGNNMTVQLQAQDGFGNPSVSYSGRVQIVVSGSGQSTVSYQPASGIVTFIAGAASFTLSDTVPETLSLSLLDVDQTGLSMSSTQAAQFYAGAWYKMAIVSVSSQQAAGGSGSVVVVACQDLYGNQVLSGCSGSLSLTHNSSHIAPASPVTLTLSSVTGQASVTLSDSQVETVNVSLRDTGGLATPGILVNASALFYSTGPPVGLVASTPGYSVNSSGWLSTTVDNGAVGVSLTVTDSFGTPCNYVTSSVLVTCTSVSGNATGCGNTTITSGRAALSIFDPTAEAVRVSFSGSFTSLPYAVNVSFGVGAVKQLAFGPAVWTGSASLAVLKVGMLVNQSVQAEDQYGNLVPTYTGQLTVSVSGSAYAYIVSGHSQVSSLALTVSSGVGVVRVNDTVASTAVLKLTDTFNTHLTMGNSTALSFSAGSCVKVAVVGVFGSAYYDFPAYSSWYYASSAWPPGVYYSPNQYVPLNTSQNVQVTLYCEDGSGNLDSTVSGPQYTLTFSHNQTAVINGPCTMTGGVCTVYFQSFAAGYMTFAVRDVNLADKQFAYPATNNTVLFYQNPPIIWGVTGQSGTTDGNSLRQQVVTLTGQTFMCGQDFVTPPLIQLVDGITGLVGNCTVTYFNSTYATCLLPQGQGKPEMVMTVCAGTALNVTQLHLPRWPNDAYFYVFGRTNEYCTSTYTRWDIGGHTWSDNCFCTKLGRALLDTRFYQPPVPGSWVQGNIPAASYFTYASVPPEVLVTHKCTAVQELNEPWGWPSTFMCIPQQAPYAWQLSRTGIGAGQSCVPIREGSDPYWSDGSHYMCTPSNTPYPDVDGIQLYYYAAPYITSISPPTANCSGNITITLTGSSFGVASQVASGPNVVTVGGKTCVINPARYNHTYMECALPAGETATNAVVMLIEGVQSTSVNNFPYLPPFITGISPSAGLTQGGDLITIRGYNFGFSSAQATVAGSACTLTSYNNTVIVCLTPAGTGTQQPVYVTTNYQSNVQPYYWSYIPPIVSTVSPLQYDSAGQATLTVTGQSFGASGAVTTVGGALCGAVAQNHTYLLCVLPAGQGYALTVQVVQSGQSSNPSGLFSYNPPVIVGNVSPRGCASGSGAYITLTGTSFGVSGVVTVNQQNCDWTSGGSWQHHLIYCAVPAGSGANVPVQVQVGGQSSNNVTFSYSPVITALQAAQLYTQGGSLVTLTGTGFNTPSVVNDSVTVNGVNGAAPCTVTSQNETMLVCVLPAGQGTANTVQVSGQFALLSNAFTFAYSPPVVQSAVPTVVPAAGRINVTLYGASFGFGSQTTLTLNSVVCTILTANHTTIVFVAPPGSGTANKLIVRVAGQVGNTWPFAYSPPSITSLTPVSGRTLGQYPIQLFGSSFGNGTVVPVVSLGGTLVAIVARNDTYINVLCPVGQGTVAIYVILDGQVSNTVTFTYNPPSLASISPTSGPTNGNGTLLTLTGDSFGTTGTVYLSTASGSSVTTCPLQATGYQQQQIVCALPSGMGTNLQVTVTSAGQQSNALSFSYNPPSILTVQPSQAPTDGGAILTISGASFGQSGTVALNGTQCVQAGPGTTYTDSLIACQLAAGQGTNLMLNVSVSGQSVALVNAFSYAPPYIASLVPPSAPAAGGSTLTLIGANFGQTAFVTLNGTLGQPAAQACQQVGLGQSNEQITCTVPANQGPAIPVYVTVGGQQSPVTYLQYAAPVVSSVSPSLGATDGSTVITVRGVSFGLGYNYSLTLNGSAVACQHFNDSTITFSMAAGVGTGLPLALTVALQPASYPFGVPLLLSYQPPTIVQVRGCANVSGPVATSCGTAGLGVIAIDGTNFGVSARLVTVTVGGLPCTNASIATPHARINCTLPAAPSGGYAMPVTVTVAGQSTTQPYVSYAGPTILAGSLTFANGSSTASSSLTVSDPLLHQDVISFQGMYWSQTASELTVTYGLPAQSKQYVCGNVSVALLTGAADTYQLNCTVAVGVGSGLTFVVKVSLLTSPEGTDALSYPTPVIVPSSIHASGAALANVYFGAINPGDVVLFNVLHVGATSSLLSVYVSQSASGPFVTQCNSPSIVAVNGSISTLSCSMPSGSGSGWLFQVVALNTASQPGTDQYDYPQSPIVYSVSGCSASSTLPSNATALCATVGGAYLSINGTYFDSRASHLSVRVGSLPCASIVAISTSQLWCELESGSGYNQPVTVTKDQLASLPVPYLSYAPAVVSSVSGCVDSGNNTVDCARAGGDTITVRGSNFGPLPPLVLIGGAVCTAVLELADGLEAGLTCRTPPGSNLALPLIVVQAGGPVTATSAVQLSYLPCPQGTYQSASDASCISCPAGQYQSTPGQGGCLQCLAGSVPSSDRTQCVQCAAGSISAAGDATCTNCTAGSYTPQLGYSACVQCGVGTYSNSSGATACSLCAIGSASSALSATSCTACYIAGVSTVGQYADYAGALTCSPCPNGTEAASLAGAGCTVCPAGYSSPAGSTACSACLMGYYSELAGAESCVACDSGTFGNASGLSSCAQCAPGTYSNKTGTQGPISCTACAAGTYIDVAGQSACLSCSYGTYAPTAQSVSCSLCPAGYVSAAGATICQPCAAGSYSALNGSVSCSLCPAGFYTPLQGMSGCTACSPGSYQDTPGSSTCLPCLAASAMASSGQQACVACAAGTYQNASSAASCVACPAGQFSVKVGGSGVTACQACPAGQFAALSGQDTCQACPIGYVAGQLGQTACQACPAGMMANQTGMSACSNCTAGWYSPVDGSFECTACPIGSYAALASSTQCTPCGVGFTALSTGASTCTACDKGSYASSIGQGTCTGCQAGTYGPDSNGTGLASCIACPAGSAQSASFAQSCTPCAAGWAQAASGQGSCTQCAAGTYTTSSNATACLSCPAGTAAPSAGSTQCGACQAGSYSSSSGSGSCQACPAGSFSSQQASSCTLCTSGYYSPSAGSTSCQPCPLGQYATQTGAVACSPCPTGTFANTPAAATCLSCPIGSYQPSTGQTGCTLCTNGTYTAVVGSEACSVCAAGSIPTLSGVGGQTGSTACSACSIGSYLPAGGPDTCLQCPMGTIAPLTGMSACSACSAGSFQNSTGATACLQCAVGEYQPAAQQTSCQLCLPGSYAAAAGTATCIPCALGTASNATGLSVTCDVCQPGSYANAAGLTSCLLCAVGTAAPGLQAATCSACDAGHYTASNGTVSCSQCAAGSYQPSQGTSSCIACPVGEAAFTSGSLQCSPCAAGTYSNETGLAQCVACDVGSIQPSTGATVCELCGVGQHQPYSAQTACLLCDSGTYTAVNGTSTCTDCPVGQYQTETGATNCSSCAAGSYNPNTAQTSCQTCRPGSYTVDGGEQSCTTCAAGYYQSQPGSWACDACPAGTYQPNTGASTCIRCEQGKYSEALAATACTLCPAGSIQTLTGQTACTACPVGQYSNSPGLTSCSQCAAGSYNPHTNQSSCVPCLAGSYQLSPGMANCSLCATGTYQANNGSTTCIECAVGYYTNQTNTQSCVPCDVGTYQALSGQSACQLCPPGKYNTGQAAKVCTACAAGTFTPSLGATSCTNCPAATFQSLQGQTNCSFCQPGTYTDTEKNTECVQCPHGSYQNSSGASGCLSCGEGTYQNYLGQSACQLCSPGQSNPTTGQSTCYVCSVGTYSAVNGSVDCASCAAGTMQPNKGSTSCELCAVGEYQSGIGALSCIVCAAGQYAAVNGSSVCLDCPVGTYTASEGSSSCSNCSVGYYNGNTRQTACVACTRGAFTNTTGQSVCADCGAGTYGDRDAQVSCPACAAGYYSANSHQTACDVCAVGSFSLGGASNCLSCQPGTYQSLPGQSSCPNCTAGQSTGNVTGSVQCSPCGTGSFSLTGAEQCTPCSPGTYQPHTGNSSCMNCSTGTYTSVAGASSCSDCGLGSFGNVTGLVSCFGCDIGSDQPLTGQATCELCEVGTYTALTGTHNCYLCPTGSYTSLNSSTACTPCAAGYYQDTAGQAACKPCPVGQYADVNGSSYCKACGQGTYSTVLAARQCSSCPKGQHQDQAGQTACSNCTLGTYAATTGLPQCVACPQGSYGSSTGATACAHCAAGYYQNNISSTACDACGPGYYSGVGAAACSVCGTGQVTDEKATVSCFACPAATTQANFLQTMCVCNAGYFMPYYTPGNNSFVCQPCPLGANCTQPGTDWTNIQSLSCYWRANNQTFNFYRCPICSDCLGGLAAGSATANQDDLNTAAGSYVPVSVWDATATPCSDFRGGILCSSCIDGYEEQTGGKCVPCPSGASSFVQDVVIALLLVGLVVFSFWLMIRSDRHLFETFDRIAPLDGSSRAEHSGLSAQSSDEDSSEASSDSSDEDSDSSDSEDDSDSDSSTRSSHTSQDSVSGTSKAAGAAGAVEADGDYSRSASSVSASVSSVSSASGSDEDRDELERPHSEPSNPSTAITARVFAGPPAPAENLTYKLKIMLSFLQIATNLSSGLDITWPSLYKSFLLNFDVINFTSILGNVTSSECIGAVTYYRELLVMMLAPLAAFTGCAVLYLLPSHFDLLCFRHQTLQAKTRLRMKFWKLFLYCLFLIYPSLSSTVLRQFVCLSIDSTQWLLTNLRVQCYTSDWYFYSYVSIPFIVLYPIGIPLFFFVLLASNRHNLHERRVQAQLGFLYASYQHSLWWWEILDSVHKLFLTSVLAFTPDNAQLPLAMTAISAYSMSILVMQPFLSPSDDLLQLLALTELFMLCLAGWIYYNTTDATLDSTQDTFVSVCLIAITLLFFLAFALAALWAVRKIGLQMYHRWQSSRHSVKQLHDAEAALQQQKQQHVQLATAMHGSSAAGDVYGKQAAAGPLLEDVAGAALNKPAPLSLGGVSPVAAAGRSLLASVRSAVRTPSHSARVAPAMPPVLLSPLPLPTILSDKPYTETAAAADDSGSGTDSGSSDDSDDSGDEQPATPQQQRSAAETARASRDGSAAATQRSSSRHGGAALSRVQPLAGRASKDAWSSPSSPRQPAVARSPSFARQPSRIAPPSARQGAAAATGTTTNTVDEEKDDSDEEQSTEAEEETDERSGPNEQQQPLQQPAVIALTAAQSAGVGGEADAPASSSSGSTGPVVAPRRSVLEPLAAVRRQPTAGAAGGGKKKRKVVKAGDNFGINRGAAVGGLINSQLPSLQSLAAAFK